MCYRQAIKGNHRDSKLVREESIQNYTESNMACLISCQTPLLLFSSLFLILFFLWFSNQNYIYYFSSFTISNHNHQCKQNSSISNIEESLARARHAINKAARTRTFAGSKDRKFIPRGPIYRNPHSFYQSYIEMEKRFKIWVYKEGEPPLFHQSSAKDAYAIEGQFIDELENGNTTFLASHPDEAAMFFIPVGVSYIVVYLNRPGHYDHQAVVTVVMDYISILSNKYSYWNRSNGVDHFFVGCHDWAPDVSEKESSLFKNLTRVICNANTTEGFNPTRDATLPELKIPDPMLVPPPLAQHSNNRSILAFFAGGPHGYVRNKLFEYWEDKDADIQVYKYLPKHLNYSQLMAQTKFCLCASGYEVATPRVSEAIYAGCVPVLISDGYVPPYSDVLDWSQFSVHIPVAKIPQIKSILQRISRAEYKKKQRMVMQVQRHFILNRPAQPFDMFHMILHSIWLRRLNARLPT